MWYTSLVNLFQLLVGSIYIHSQVVGRVKQTVVVCVSASGHAIPPLMIYPRKRAVPESIRNGAVTGTLFVTSDNRRIKVSLEKQPWGRGR